MAEIEVTIALPEYIRKGSSWRLRLHESERVGSVLFTIGKMLGVNKPFVGQFPVVCALYDSARHRLLGDGQTLAEAGVTGGETLTLLRATGESFSATGLESSTTALVEFFERAKEGRCAKDGASLDDHPFVVLCKACGAPHHASCWAEAGDRCSRAACGWAGECGKGRRLGELTQAVWQAVLEQSSSLGFLDTAGRDGALVNRLKRKLEAALHEQDEGEPLQDPSRQDGHGPNGTASVHTDQDVTPDRSSPARAPGDRDTRRAKSRGSGGFEPRTSGVDWFGRRNVVTLIGLAQLVVCLWGLVVLASSRGGLASLAWLGLLVTGMTVGAIALWHRARLVAVVGLVLSPMIALLEGRLAFVLVLAILALAVGLSRELRSVERR